MIKKNGITTFGLDNRFKIQNAVNACLTRSKSVRVQKGVCNWLLVSMSVCMSVCLYALGVLPKRQTQL